jgi:hypothetical protein
MSFCISGPKDFSSLRRDFRAPVAHTYNPSNSGGRDQEDHGSKQGGANRDPILKKINK